MFTQDNPKKELFDQNMAIISESIMLANPDMNRPFILYIDSVIHTLVI